MPINLNQIDVRGLANLAGQGVPNLNLKNTGEPFLLAAQMEQQQALKVQELAQALYLAKMKEQGDMDRQMLQSQVSLANNQNTNNTLLANNQNTVSATTRGQDLLDRRGYTELQQKGMIESAKLSREDQKIAIDQQYKGMTLAQKQEEMQQKQIMDEFSKNLQMSDQQLKVKNQIYAGTLASLQDAGEDPKAQLQIQAQAIQQALDAGVITPEQAVTASKLSPSQFKTSVQMQAGITGKAAQAQGMGLTVDPETGALTLSPSKQTTTKAQADLVAADKELAQFDSLKKELAGIEADPNMAQYGTYRGAAGYDMSVKAEKSTGIPIVKPFMDIAAGLVSGKSKEEQASYVTKADRANTIIEQMFNAYKNLITGAAASDTEVESLRKTYLNKDLSPVQRVARMEVIVQSIMNRKGVDKKALSGDIGNGSIQAQPDMIRVKTADGQTGMLPANEFDPKLYTKI